MNKQVQVQVHRNKCHQCFRNTGRFIFDCYCIICEPCFPKRDRSCEQCTICRQKSKHNFIDVQDRSNVSKMSYLFSNLESSFNRCIEAYKFQAGIDAKYCKFLESQLTKYKDAISEIVMYNPEFKEYFDGKLANKSKPHHRSSSEYIPNHTPNNNQPKNEKHSQQHSMAPRSMSTSSVMMQHERLVDPQRLGANGDRNYSGKVSYKMPNINYNTALRSSKRPTQRDEDDHNFYQRHNR